MGDSRSNSMWGDPVIMSITLKSALQAVFHPSEYGKTLIQLGHEPIRPWPCRSLFSRKEHLMLPNIFQYVGYMIDKKGKAAMYQGAKLRIFELVVGQVAFHVTTESICPKSEEEVNDDVSDEDPRKERIERQRCLRRFLQELAGRTAAVVVSHPFHVCAVRCMAQFVGGETKYVGVWGSLGELYRESGVSGFFHGLIPRLLAEMLQLTLWHSLTYAITTYVWTEKEHRGWISTVSGFVASSVTYPFIVVSKCMCVSGSGLVAGQPPNMPLYSSWTDCWSHLSATNQLWRGSSIVFWRYDTRPPQIIKRL